MIKPYGPSPCRNGSEISCSKQNITNGSAKVSVFPDPVDAIPIISRPDNLQVDKSQRIRQTTPIKNTTTANAFQYYECSIRQHFRFVHSSRALFWPLRPIQQPNQLISSHEDMLAVLPLHLPHMERGTGQEVWINKEPL